MSSMSITHYFPFPRIRILRQRVSGDVRKAYLKVVPNKRFRPRCHICGRQAAGIHSQENRWIRDLDFGPARLWIHCHYRKFICTHCQKTPIEELDLFDPYLRVTKRLARYIFEICKIMTVQEVVRHLRLNWKTVKAIDQKFLEELLQLKKVINTVLILKYKLKHIWTYRSRRWAEKAIEEWCGLTPDS